MMQPRYLVLACPNPRDIISWMDRVAGQRSGTAFRLGGHMAAWASVGTPVASFADGGSVVLGHLHPYPGETTRNVGAGADRIETLMRTAWGGYIVCAPGRADRDASIFRAPMGALPCYYGRAGEGWVFASDVDLMVEMGFESPAIDWDAMTSQLAAGTMAREQTCLAGIRELPPGCVLRLPLRAMPVMSRIWSFSDHVASDPPSRDAPSPDLRSIIGHVVSSMAGEHSICAASISGGLDSSIVAASLKQGNISYLPFTFVGRDPDADETGYSRPLARHLGIDLREFPFDPSDIDLSRSSACHLPRPVGHTHAQSVAARCRRLAEEEGVDGIFTGMGGDNIFCSNRSALPLVDRFKVQGLGRGLVETLSDIRAITEASTAEVILQAVRIAWAGRRPAWNSRVEEMLSPDLRGRAEDPLGANWLRPPTGLPPGKIFHIEMVTQALPAVEGFGRRDFPAWISPLLAQPVVEACLRIPSWMWSAGGRTRSVAREAFRPLLPETIAYRRSKGGPDSFSRDIAIEHASRVRETLLDGELVQRGILDRLALERTLTEKALLTEGKHSQLLHLVDTEAWIAHWRGAGAGPVSSGAARILSQRA